MPKEPLKPSKQAKKPAKATEPEAATPEKKIPATFWVPKETVEKLRDVCYWDRVPLADLAGEAFSREIDRREKKRGEPFPPREKKLKAGRPIR